MLKIWCLVSDFFQLLREIPSKLTSNIVNNSLGISKVFLKEGFEFWLCDWSSILVAALMLSQSEADSAIEK